MSKAKGKKKGKDAKKGKGKGGGEEIYVKIATKLIGSDWTSVFAALDAKTKKALFAQLDAKKAILKKRKAAEDKKVGQKKGGAKKAGGGGGADKGRKISYRFGSRNLQVMKPSKGYPDAKTAKRGVEGKLKLMYAHGYSGNFDESRQNIYLSQDGKYLIYYIAAVVIVFDYEANTQRFFTRHNDDITSICLSPKKTWCASGQKDPKDEPGKGKDLPKIYIWNYKTMKSVQLIDNVCWGKIGRVQWSKATNYLWCICGDPDQTLKAWDPAEFGKKEYKKKEIPALIKCNTMREIILGFEINPNPAKDNVDEFLAFGKRKFAYCNVTKEGKGLKAKFKAVSIVSLKKEGEKSFACGQFIGDGRYLVGSQSGAVYVGKGNQALALLPGAHDKSVGAMYMLSQDKVLTAGSDRKFKTFSVAAECKDGDSGLEQTWECSVEVKDSDVVLQPRAIAYNDTTGTIFCGTKTNQILKFEMKSEDASVVVDGHDGQIWALCTSPTDAIFATGGYDNAVKIWNAKTLKCIATYEFEIDEDSPPKGYQIHTGAWSNKGDILAFGTEDSNIAFFTYREGELKFIKMINIPPKNENAEIENVEYLRFSDDSTLLAAAHMDSNMYIYSVTGCDGGDVDAEQWDPMGCVAAPTNVQFSADGKMVKCLTRDYEVAHFSLDADAKKGKFVAGVPDPDKVAWADDPLIAGWDTQGLYQPGWDGTDLNDATLTSDSKLVATGDDYGCVRLHNYPSISQTPCLEYSGHAEFVVGVEFLRDDSQLITCGGNDMAIFQWKLIKGGKK